MLLDTQVSRVSSSTQQYDVVVVGAGPYGLSIAAHLLARGIKVAVFGKPLELWRDHMPQGMLLRSPWWASSLSDPGKRYRMEDYLQTHSVDQIFPLPMDTFIDYALWFQKKLVPDVDETYVASIKREHDLFIVKLEDGRVLQCNAVVMAIGQGLYTHRPVEYRHLPPELVSHTNDITDFERFVGKEVVILGAGQSAVETAALAHENGVHVHLVTRRPIVWMEPEEQFPDLRPLMERLRHPKAGISSDWFSWAIEHFPYALQRLPMSLKARYMFRFYGPMASDWLQPRIFQKVKLYEAQPVQSFKETDSGLEFSLTSRRTIKADHLILGTGYRADIRRLPMLHPSLTSAIHTYTGSPILNNHFETNIPGFYFVGYTSVLSCGPFYRFVVGTDAAACQVVRAIIATRVRV